MSHFCWHIPARETDFTDRERRLFERHRELEQIAMSRLAEAEALREKLQVELLEREFKLKEAAAALDLEKDRYNEEARKRIERTSGDYVSQSLTSLEGKERQFHRISTAWSALGAITLTAAIIYFVWLSIDSTVDIPATVTWEFIAFAAFRGLFVVALLAGLAKYSLIFSRSYMQESLKYADRRHAINFGKFYLESYGAAADWTQVKEAFEHWNITANNAFSEARDSKLDLSSMEAVVSLMERAGKAVPSIGPGRAS